MKNKFWGFRLSMRSLDLGVPLLLGSMMVAQASFGETVVNSSNAQRLEAQKSIAFLSTEDNDKSCLFYVDGLAKIKTKFDENRYTVNSLRTELTINIPRERILRVGQWSKWADGKILESTSLSTPPQISEEHGFDPVSGRYVIQTPFSWGTSFCRNCGLDDEYSGKISEFSWWVEYLDKQNKPQTVWYSNFGLNFHVDEIFAWPTYSSGSPQQIYMWLDQNAPLFDGKRFCE
jgi:hypothetical protein